LDLNLNDEQRMLQDMVARICSKFCDSAAVRRVEGSESGYLPELWQQLIELGLSGLIIDEQYGGSQSGLLDLALVYEQLGRVLAPTPHWVSCVLSARLIQQSGNAAIASELLPAIASGSSIVTTAWLEPSGSAESAGIQLAATLETGGFVLQGEKVLVPYVGIADLLIVLARVGKSLDGVGLFAVPANSPGLAISLQPNHAGEALFHVGFNAVHVQAEKCLAQGEAAWLAWQSAMDGALIALSAQAVGGAAAILEMSNDYAKERHAFDRPIGSFQSIAHYLADVATELESARVLAWQAAWAHDEGRSDRQLAAMAKLHACSVFRRATAVGVQIHGGMGFSLEADPQLYFRRAKQLQLLHWDPGFLEQRIADQVLSGSTMAGGGV
jgi:alkylation response protein AidB-like acyl-CoA dehydrogenase